MKAIWNEPRWRMGLILGGAIAIAAVFAARSDAGATSAPPAPPAAGDPDVAKASVREDSVETGALPPGHPPIDAPPGGAAERPPRQEIALAIEGKVEEVLPASRYSYLRFATPNGEAWAAVEGDAIKAGDRVRVTHAIEMDGFTSPTLGRTFAKIYFGTAEPSPSRP